jgi:RimJ/RimL family protein N-acetyltransferase
MAFAFETIGVRRLEARAAVENGRGNAALRKVGAIPEGILRGAFVKDGVEYDQVMWSVLATDWQYAALPLSVSIH